MEPRSITPALGQLYDDGVTIFAVSVALMVISSVLVGLRCYVRFTLRKQWIDDYLCIAGQVSVARACIILLPPFRTLFFLSAAFFTTMAGS